MEVIVGTAGHIDHGKTALVKALTGVDADRLPEEKRRGITVDIGFADLSLGDVHVGFVDVPGHERFVKNMLAGASGIDLLLLVIAASEGVMPQTREHFDICRLLGITAGIVVLTKSDLVDAETLELAKLDAAELVVGSFLETADVIIVSARTGSGIEELKDAIVRASTALPARADDLITRLPIDRSFSMKGFGAVVTGTLASGTVSDGDELELLPQQQRVRVRGVQTHGRSVPAAHAGQRVAVNLGGVDHNSITRGMLLAEPGVLQPTQLIDTSIEVLPDAPRPLRSRQRVRLHLGTVEVLARVHVLSDTGELTPGAAGLIQLRLETPVVAVPGERFILRSYSPQVTIAGGEVIDSAAAKVRRRDIPATMASLQALLSAGDDRQQRLTVMLRAAGTAGLSFTDLRSRTGIRKEVLLQTLDSMVGSKLAVNAGEIYLDPEAVKQLSTAAESTLAAHHKREPLSRGMPREAFKEQVCARVPDVVFQFVLRTLESNGRVLSDKDTVRLASHSAELSPDETKVTDAIRKQYADAGLEVPKLEDVLTTALSGTRLDTTAARKLFQRLLDAGEVVKVTDEFYFSREAVDTLAAQIKNYAAAAADRLIDVPKFKELAGVSRKYAIPLLEYFDREHVTARAGDKRIIL